jgi:hypothetical protein
MDCYVHRYVHPSGTKNAEHRRATHTVEEMPVIINPDTANPGTPLEGIWTAKEGEEKEKGMETDPSPGETKYLTEGERIKKLNAMKFVQINLHHIKVPTAVLRQRLAEGMADGAPIQEARIYRGQIRGLVTCISEYRRDLDG